MQRTPIRTLADPALVTGLVAAVRARETFGSLEAGLVERLVGEGALVEAEPGAALIREDERSAPEIYLLVAGALAVQSQGQPIARLDRPGDVVGETAVLMQSRRTADVVADGPARLVAIPATVLARPEFADVVAALRGAMLRDDWIQY